MNLKDYVAVITGGTSGIGEATVRLFVERGARVVIVGRNEERGTALERELGESVSFVITGGGAAYVDRLVTHPHSYDPDMILKGLAYLYRLNKKEK